ncbi:MAG: phosphoribosyltransferase-like protein [Acidobacteriota bacterium]
MSDAGVSAASVGQEFVLAKCDAFTAFQIWPLRSRMDPKRWLQNFRDEEIAYAVHLLNGFTYFCEGMVDQMLLAAFQGISRLRRNPRLPPTQQKGEWLHFLETALITPVQGENPSATDSGYVFSRKARQLLFLDEDRILEPKEAIQRLVDKGPRPVVFVDDFVGSGNQFLATWWRNYKVNGVDHSFRELSNFRGSDFYYCMPVCTPGGRREIMKHAPVVSICPANMLSERHSALHPKSLIWPAHLRVGARDSLSECSQRAGIPDNDGGVDDWRGFHKLALALAFSHGVPDATLPLFYWDHNGWQPLVRRT